MMCYNAKVSSLRLKENADYGMIDDYLLGNEAGNNVSSMDINSA